MKLESQVVSLELSKRLKELGVMQESLFWYTYAPKDKQDGEWVHVLTYGRNNMLEETISAFTVAELGEMLPSNINHALDEDDNNGAWLSCGKSDDGVWWIDYGEDGVARFEIFDDEKNEANSRALMLIYLIENKLITV